MTPHSGQVLDTIDYHGREISIIDCRECGYVHATPLPTQDELTALYEREYFDGPKADFKADDERDAAWIRMLMDERLDWVLSHFEGRLLPSEVELLDVGCGFGTMLAAAEDRGCKVVGLDPSKQALAECIDKGFKDVFPGFFDSDFESRLGQSDVIHTREVLNHAPNPLELAERARRMLFSTGVFCGSVANDYNPLQLAARDQLGTSPFWLAYPHHLNYFTPESLVGLLRRAGFAHVEVTGSYPIELHLLMGEDYVADKALGREVHQKRVRADLALAEAGLRTPLYEALIRQGLGREIVFYAWN